VMSAGHRSLTRRDALTDNGAGHCLFIRYFLAAAKANGSSLSIVLPFISVFTVSMSFSSLMVLGFLRVSDRRTALAAATI
jgi:hypothetical protein